MLLMLIFTVKVSSQNVGSEISYYIERMEMIFVGMEHKITSNLGNTYKFKLESILVEYEGDFEYEDELGYKSNLQYKKIKKHNELVGLKNYKLLYPIFKHKYKNINVTIVKKRFKENHMSFSLIEDEKDKKNLFFIIYM